MKTNIPQYDEYYKVALLGNSNVGKTSFINSYLKRASLLKNEATLGVGFITKIVKFKDDDGEKNIKLAFWDTAGQERFRSIVKLYLKKLHGIILMYDIKSDNCYEELSYWYNLINEETENIYLIVVCNKCDLKDTKNNIENGRSFCKLNEIPFFECSVKKLENIDNVVYNIMDLINKNEKDYEMVKKISNNLFTIKEKNNSYCQGFC